MDAEDHACVPGRVMHREDYPSAWDSLTFCSAGAAAESDAVLYSDRFKPADDGNSVKNLERAQETQQRQIVELISPGTEFSAAYTGPVDQNEAMGSSISEVQPNPSANYNQGGIPVDVEENDEDNFSARYRLPSFDEIDDLSTTTALEVEDGTGAEYRTGDNRLDELLRLWTPISA